MTVTIERGFVAEHRQEAARLYYEAFRQKLHPIFRDETKALAVLTAALNGDHALVATVDGALAGIAGFKDADGQMVALQPRHMTDTFGFIGGWWRLLALSLFERKLADGTLLMDGIVVSPAMRGQGVGSRLLDAMVDYAREEGYDHVRLDVVDTNPRARQLYERQGFIAQSSEHYPLLRRIFGFSGSTTMLKAVER